MKKENSFPLEELHIFLNLKSLLVRHHKKRLGHFWWQMVWGVRTWSHLFTFYSSYKLAHCYSWNYFNDKRWPRFVPVILFTVHDKLFLMAETIWRTCLKNQHLKLWCLSYLPLPSVQLLGNRLILISVLWSSQNHISLHQVIQHCCYNDTEEENRRS